MRPSAKPHKALTALLLILAAAQLDLAHAQDVSQWIAACAVCHAKNSVPTDSATPIIWGQNRGYVYLQLRDFKSATRASVNDVAMHALTQTMSDAQMLAIATYVSAQPWPKPLARAIPPGEPLLLRGATLLAYGDCGACHFNNWNGYSANPRLRGQTAAYLKTTIGEFRSGKRRNSPGMSDLLLTYSEMDAEAIVTYLSNLD